ncbi:MULTISPECIES: hypothetical protein [Bacillus]|uniref:hypothetical protein n=1 Tax=Bacillus TaxID=1386 RepID=UPI000AB22BCE|nr:MULTISPECIES: hypothetical protein [Bacillus cereus group]WIL44761.1 hypothetical protein QP042_02275 [Bacillus bombysepticus]EKS8378871.1 hypothetical protein [Bacillus cereus]EKS8385357.1 hypothetical protein [Bacillus cereus]EMA7399307.1 hypothetical protein [Bacillus cereus]MEB8692997.1 hypothetical protein [Bacillus cereus]
MALEVPPKRLVTFSDIQAPCKTEIDPVAVVIDIPVIVIRKYSCSLLLAADIEKSKP